MKNKLLLLLPMLTLSLIGINKGVTSVYASSVSSSYITEAQLNNYLNNNNYRITYQEPGLSKDYYYTRYELYTTRTFGDRYFLNVKVEHNADLADTIITVDSISFIGLSHTEGLGFSAEASVPGYYCSFTADMNVTTSTDYAITKSRSFTLKGKENSSYDASGTYYLYYRESFVDSIIVKRTLSGIFVSAEYYSSSPEDVFSMEMIQTRPTTNATVLPAC